jgi:hypothetical protein
MEKSSKTIMKILKKIKMMQTNITDKQIEIKKEVYLPMTEPDIRKILMNIIVILKQLEERMNNTSSQMKMTMVLTISKIPLKIITINDLFIYNQSNRYSLLGFWGFG